MLLLHHRSHKLFQEDSVGSSKREVGLYDSAGIQFPTDTLKHHVGMNKGPLLHRIKLNNKKVGSIYCGIRWGQVVDGCCFPFKGNRGVVPPGPQPGFQNPESRRCYLCGEVGHISWQCERLDQPMPTAESVGSPNVHFAALLEENIFSFATRATCVFWSTCIHYASLAGHNGPLRP